MFPNQNFTVVHTPNGPVMMPSGGVQRLTNSSLPMVYKDGIFSLCVQDGLITLSMGPNNNKLANWLTWEPSIEAEYRTGMISWSMGDESTRQGWVGDPCADPNSVEFGEIETRYNGFGRLRRSAPVSDITEAGQRLCDRQPRYRLDDTRIDNDYEFRSMLAAEEVAKDLASQLIIGNSSTAGQFDGLRRIVRTGFTDASGVRSYLMDSIVIDWNNNSVNGGSGATWTDGRGLRSLAATLNLIDVLRETWRIIKMRIGMSGMSARTLQAGDAALVMTSQMCTVLKDLFTYWSIYTGVQYYEASFPTIEGRAFRDELDGGLYGDGYIKLHGDIIPIICYDYELQTGPATTEMFLLVKGVGGMRTLWGQHVDMREAERIAKFSEFASSDNGRFLHWQQEDHTCVQQVLELRPRIISTAPWTCARIQNIQIASAGGHISPDPFDSSYFPESSFVLASA